MAIPLDTNSNNTGNVTSIKKCSPNRYGSAVGRRSTTNPVQSANGRNYTASHSPPCQSSRNEKYRCWSESTTQTSAITAQRPNPSARRRGAT